MAGVTWLIQIRLLIERNVILKEFFPILFFLPRLLTFLTTITALLFTSPHFSQKTLNYQVYLKSRLPSNMGKRSESPPLNWATKTVCGDADKYSSSPPETFKDCGPFIRHRPQNSQIDKPDMGSTRNNNNDTATGAATTGAAGTSFPRNTSTDKSSNPRLTKDSISAEKCSKLSPAKKLPSPHGSSNVKRPATAQMSEEVPKWPDGEALERFTGTRSSYSLRERDDSFRGMHEEKQKGKGNGKGGAV